MPFPKLVDSSIDAQNLRSHKQSGRSTSHVDRRGRTPEPRIGKSKLGNKESAGLNQTVERLKASPMADILRQDLLLRIAQKICTSEEIAASPEAALSKAFAWYAEYAKRWDQLSNNHHSQSQ
jgi:hypothetical protein